MANLTSGEIRYLANKGIVITTPESFPEAHFKVSGEEYSFDATGMVPSQILSVYNIMGKVALNVAIKMGSRFSQAA
jgi:hypothetical protein